MNGCRPFTKDEYDKIILSINENHKYSKRNACFITVGIYTGFRISEILSLRVKQIYAPNGKIQPTISVEAKNMKAKKGRSVDVSPILHGVLKIYWKHLQDIKKTNPNDYIFYSQKPLSDGTTNHPIKMRQAYYIITETCDELGILGKIGTHSLRKTYAKNSLRLAEGDIHLLQKLMGHAKIDSTMHYIEVHAEKLHDIMKNQGFKEEEKGVEEAKKKIENELLEDGNDLT
jgi:integrase